MIWLLLPDGAISVWPPPEGKMILPTGASIEIGPLALIVPPPVTVKSCPDGLCKVNAPPVAVVENVELLLKLVVVSVADPADVLFAAGSVMPAVSVRLSWPVTVEAFSVTA